MRLLRSALATVAACAALGLGSADANDVAAQVSGEKTYKTGKGNNSVAP